MSTPKRKPSTRRKQPVQKVLCRDNAENGCDWPLPIIAVLIPKREPQPSHLRVQVVCPNCEIQHVSVICLHRDSHQPTVH